MELEKLPPLDPFLCKELPTLGSSVVIGIGIAKFSQCELIVILFFSTQLKSPLLLVPVQVPLTSFPQLVLVTLLVQLQGFLTQTPAALRPVQEGVEEEVKRTSNLHREWELSLLPSQLAWLDLCCCSVLFF